MVVNTVTNIRPKRTGGNVYLIFGVRIGKEFTLESKEDHLTSVFILICSLHLSWTMMKTQLCLPLLAFLTSESISMQVRKWSICFKGDHGKHRIIICFTGKRVFEQKGKIYCAYNFWRRIIIVIMELKSGATQCRRTLSPLTWSVDFLLHFIVVPDEFLAYGNEWCSLLRNLWDLHQWAFSSVIFAIIALLSLNTFLEYKTSWILSCKKIQLPYDTLA